MVSNKWLQTSEPNKILFSLFSPQQYLIPSYNVADGSSLYGLRKLQHISNVSVNVFIFYELAIHIPDK